MENSIRQYFPGFFDGFEPETVGFDTTEELLAIPWVKRFEDRQIFLKWEMSDSGALRAVVMGKRGKDERWVVGFIDKPELVDLPEVRK